MPYMVPPDTRSAEATRPRALSGGPVVSPAFFEHLCDLFAVGVSNQALGAVDLARSSGRRGAARMTTRAAATGTSVLPGSGTIMSSFALQAWQGVRSGQLDELDLAHGAVGGKGPGRRYA